MTMRDYCSDLGLAIHAHRAMHAAFDRNKKHGVTMYFLAKLMRLIGVSQIHTGTAVGKLTGTKTESILLADFLGRRRLQKSPTNVLHRTGDPSRMHSRSRLAACTRALFLTFLISTVKTSSFLYQEVSMVTPRVPGPAQKQPCRQLKRGRRV